VFLGRRRFRRIKGFGIVDFYERAICPEEILVANNKDKQKKKQKPQSGIRRFYRETVGELRKVTWPTREEAKNLTIIVVAVTFGMSAFLGIVDFLFSRLFALILGV
jgi:preprotein translocase subunit SecE